MIWMGSALIEGIGKKYELSEDDIERVLEQPLIYAPDRVANGAGFPGRSVTRHLGHVFGASRHVRTAITLGASARFMHATFHLAMLDMMASAKALGADAIINVRVETSQGDSYYVNITADAVTTLEV